MANVIEPAVVVADSSILAARDRRINGFREIENNSKYNIIRGMITSRENMKYNKHLTPVYLKAKEMFDTMVDEQNSQISYLQGILTHLDNILQEYTKPDGNKRRKIKGIDKFIEGIVQDKKKVSKLLIRMRNVLNKLNEIDTITSITTEMMDKYTPEDFIVYDDDGADVDDDADADEAEVLFLLNARSGDSAGSGSESSSDSGSDSAGSESGSESDDEDDE